ncbi:hypothetical protein O181_053697 [Austropuccinia psidii MF-1]|uniref:Uncharacterized protein n=1 Tax=Austropuccinia psidii MF-1 TaxID=1389203 RepID=A0A9Q3E5D9_9BASI|nr:hypothetical protein [Austropuccinia psidii MF-1]
MTVGTQPHNNIDLINDVSLNHNAQVRRKQRRMLVYMNQTSGLLAIYNPNFSILTLEKKKDYNASFLKLPPQNLLPRPYVLINQHDNPYFQILMYQVNPFSRLTPFFHQLETFIIMLNKISTKTDILHGVMKGT